MNMKEMNEQSLHFGVFGGIVNTVMEGRLTASPEYRELLDALTVTPLPGAKEERREVILAEVSSRSTPLMAELLFVIKADWADQDAHWVKYRNRGRDRFATVKRLQKMLARAA